MGFHNHLLYTLSAPFSIPEDFFIRSWFNGIGPEVGTRFSSFLPSFWLNNAFAFVGKIRGGILVGASWQRTPLVGFVGP